MDAQNDSEKKVTTIADLANSDQQNAYEEENALYAGEDVTVLIQI